jgi:hypothetical protein
MVSSPSPLSLWPGSTVVDVELDVEPESPFLSFFFSLDVVGVDVVVGVEVVVGVLVVVVVVVDVVDDVVDDVVEVELVELEPVLVDLLSADTIAGTDHATRRAATASPHRVECRCVMVETSPHRRVGSRSYRHGSRAS